MWYLGNGRKIVEREKILKKWEFGNRHPNPPPESPNLCPEL